MYFRAIYPDASIRGRIATRELGMVYSRDVLGDGGSVEGPAPYLLLDVEQPEGGSLEKEGEKERERGGEKGREGEGEKGRTLEGLRFQPGDYVCVNVVLPKHLSGSAPVGPEVIGGARLPSGPGGGGMGLGSGAGTGAGAGANGWGNGGGNSNAAASVLRGDRHWRGGSDPAAGRSRIARAGPGRNERAVRERERERERVERVRGEPERGGGGGVDRRGPPPRRGRDRDSLPPPTRAAAYGRGAPSRSRSRTRSPSRSPPPRRRARYD